MSKKHAVLLLTDDVLYITPAIPSMRSLFSFVEKSIEKGERGRSSIKKQTRYFVTEQPNADGRGNSFATYPGMWYKATQWLLEHGWTYDFHNQCLPFPAPRLDKMGGFRFSQGTLLTQALLMNRSGYIEAPTRWGKSTLIKNTMRAYEGIPIVLITPGVDLIEQTLEDVKRSLPGREVTLLSGSSRKRTQSEDITICSMGSIHKLEPNMTKLILVDEPHQLVTDTKLEEFFKLTGCRRIAYGATLGGRFDNRDILIEATFGPALAVRTFREAVAEGAICPIHVYMLMVPIRNFSSRSYDRNHAYNVYLRQNAAVRDNFATIRKTIVPPEWQTLMFITDQKQAEFYAEAFPGVKVAMDKVMTTKERKACLVDMQAEVIKDCIASNIYSTGVTFSRLRCIFNVSGGGKSATGIQKPGRLAEIQPDKKCGVMFDVFFYVPDDVLKARPDIESDPVMQLCRESRARAEAYTEKGYDVFYPHTFTELQEMFKNSL